MSDEAAPDQPKAPMPIDKPLVCGIVMPISNCDGCSENHWTDVREIISGAIDAAGFTANLVSQADEVTIIHKTIVTNLYNNQIVVCDVSGKNPNVMLELGIRLAFDKPTIVVKDDKTAYSFDTSPLEHLGYPRDLRFQTIVDFKKLLTEKIKATYKKSVDDKEYTTFLKHFGQFKVVGLETKTGSMDEFILNELREIRTLVESRKQDPAVRFKPNAVIAQEIVKRCIALANRKQIVLTPNTVLDMVNEVIDSEEFAKQVSFASRMQLKLAAHQQLLKHINA